MKILFCLDPERPMTNLSALTRQVQQCHRSLYKLLFSASSTDSSGVQVPNMEFSISLWFRIILKSTNHSLFPHIALTSYCLKLYLSSLIGNLSYLDWRRVHIFTSWHLDIPKTKGTLLLSTKSEKCDSLWHNNYSCQGFWKEGLTSSKTWQMNRIIGKFKKKGLI